MGRTYLIIIGLLVMGLAVAPAAGAVAKSPAQDAGAALMGDVNCSATVDAIDALQILRQAAGLSTSAACMNQAGDVDCSGAIDAIDALKVLRYVAGLAVQTPAGCTPIGQALGGGPTSEELIDQALAAHQVDPETAVVYKIYAAFGDSRLPPQYKGDDSAAEDTAATDQAAISFNSLSAPAQADVAPFLLPPSAPGSWLGLQSVPQAAAAQPQDIQWTTYPAAGGKVKVWAQDRYPGDAEKAQGVADAVTGKIWDALTGLMGANHQPLSDVGLANNGGDGALDIYLVHIEDRGVAEPSDPNNACQLSPRYLNVNSDRPLGSETSPGIIQTVAHEMFHAFQFTYPLATGCWYPEYAWFTEASAKWVEDYVYPDAQSEQPYAEDFLKYPYLPLDDVSGLHAYGDYLLPYFLARVHSLPQIVPAIWSNFGSSTSLKAVNDALQAQGLGDFDKVWPEFALDNWNRAPVDHYKTLDQLADGAAEVGGGTVAVTLGGGAKQTYELASAVKYLAAFYHHFSFGDDSVHSVVFENNIPGYPHASLQALVKIQGEWKAPEDWTNDERETFCRDVPSQHIEELVVIISYSNWQAKDAIAPVERPKLIAQSAGCTDWEGWSKAEIHYAGGAIIKSTQTDLHFKAADPQPDPANRMRFDLTEVTGAQWTASGSIPGCSLSGTVTVAPVGSPDGVTEGWLETYPDKTYAGVAGGATVGHQTFTAHCGGTDTPWLPDEGMDFFYTGFLQGNQASLTDTDAGTVAQGSWSGDACNAPGGCTGTFTWDLHQAPPP